MIFPIIGADFPTVRTFSILDNLVKEINLEERMPTCDDALSELKTAIQSAKQSKYKCLIIIHGYGSSGKGGKIREKARQWLNAQVRNLLLKTLEP